MMFCSDFDERLSLEGPGAIFLPDREGLLRFDAEWTRGAWGRHPGPHAPEPAWFLLRDHGTGFVVLAYASARGLLADHPRMDVRSYPDREAALAARAGFGRPPLCEEPW
jgi:hypothetical protein